MLKSIMFFFHLFIAIMPIKLNIVGLTQTERKETLIETM